MRIGVRTQSDWFFLAFEDLAFAQDAVHTAQTPASRSRSDGLLRMLSEKDAEIDILQQQAGAPTRRAPRAALLFPAPRQPGGIPPPRHADAAARRPPC